MITDQITLLSPIIIIYKSYNILDVIVGMWSQVNKPAIINSKNACQKISWLRKWLSPFKTSLQY